MYDRKQKCWCADCDNEELLRWCRENPHQMEAAFILASELLTDLSDGSQVAEAVAMMEAAAKQEYPKAMFAMGQMFQYGWGVHKDHAKAVEWYQKAAEKGSPEARKTLEDMKRRRIIGVVSVVAAALVCVGIGLGIFFGLRSLDGKLTIRVHRDTELAQTATLDEFSNELQDLIRDHDDALVISGQVSTNRLLLRFEGDYLDLSDFLADKVVSRSDNLIIIQFSSEEEAQRCMQWLQALEGISFVQEDKYHSRESTRDTEGELLPVVSTIDPQNGCFSWGTIDLGLDQLSQHVAQYYSDREVLVAVVDGGVLPTVEQADRLAGCINIMDGNTDIYPDEHGTHVAGIILDGTRGTNTYVLSVDVYGSMTGTADSIMALGIDSAVYMGADVINMSQRWDEHSPILEQAALNAVAQGVVFAKSAGNMAGDVMTGISCPGELEELLVTGAYDINHNAADFTNYGDSVDVCAPGVDIFSYCHTDPSLVITMSGTSMASPHMAAMAALLKIIYPNATPAQIEHYIEASCRTNRNPSMYATGQYGAGAPDATAFIEWYLD